LSIAFDAFFPDHREMPKKKTPRVRRTAEAAREVILDAAEKRVREGGPEAIRLQEIAKDVGVSHPAVLHHFGSREGLVEAVVERTMDSLEADLFAAIGRGSANGEALDGRKLMEAVAEVLGERGHARLIAWLALSDKPPMRSKAAREGWKMIADATHALRLARLKGKAKERATAEDTRFTVLLSAIALFGEALIGASALEAAGIEGDPEEVRSRFRAWLAKLLEQHLEHPFD
jgi:AcrR family transcriptional regulator